MTIMKSEKAKAYKAIEKATGIKCDITGAGWKDGDANDEIMKNFTEVKFEMCDSKTGRFVGYVIMQIVKFDRRRSWVSAVQA